MTSIINKTHIEYNSYNATRESYIYMCKGRRENIDFWFMLFTRFYFYALNYSKATRYFLVSFSTFYFWKMSKFWTFFFDCCYFFSSWSTAIVDSLVFLLSFLFQLFPNVFLSIQYEIFLSFILFAQQRWKRFSQIRKK